jgi:aspartokinase-like uncharacterized kinase
MVVKLGGGLLAYPERLAAALAAVAATARERRLLIVPGGGPFADAVRVVDAQLRLSDDAAHWMAILAMDQYAHLLASRLDGGVVVHDRSEIARVLDAGGLPVLAPSRWLRKSDPLPHAWDVTSDSIAAWVAGALGARELVLIKPPGAAGPSAVDRHFTRARPAQLEVAVVAADQLDPSSSIAAIMRFNATVR